MLSWDILYVMGWSHVGSLGVFITFESELSSMSSSNPPQAEPLSHLSSETLQSRI